MLTLASFSPNRRRVGALPSGGGSGDDWAARIAALGGNLVLANRLEDATKLVAGSPADDTHWLLANGNQDHVTLDTTVKVPGAAGSWRWDIRATDGANNGDVGVYFGSLATFGNGSTVWFSYRIRVPATETYMPWQVPPGNVVQAKRSILSYHAGSNQPNEIVVTNNGNFGQFGGYVQDGLGNFNDIATNSVNACSSTDFNYEPSIDNGSNPLTGNDPDTGAAWSACAQTRRQFGRLYSAKDIASVRHGFGDPLCGGVRQLPDEWFTVTGRVVIGNFGSSNNRWTLWAARDGQPYIKVFDATNILLGATGPDYDTLWLLPYVTARIANTGTKITGRTSGITGAEILTSGLDTPTGAGTLEYNATTGRFRWMGNGESFGTARGFSAANNLLTLNVCSGTAADSYLVVRVTPGLLPPSGTVTDTVTIAAVRPDSFMNINDVIIARQAINAPGGFVPS